MYFMQYLWNKGAKRQIYKFQLLVQDFEIVILNGRTAGNEKGEIILCKPGVIQLFVYVEKTVDRLRYINFKVGAQIGSDHTPI